ncbi:general transcription factor IIE subunit 1-like, partial [Tropilaelaps mercedesae]
MDVADEIPPDLPRLARMIIKNFYSPELLPVVNFLLIHKCVREETLADRLLLEKKQLHQIIVYLRQERLVQMRLRMETGADGKSQRHYYYYVNYYLFVNVVKYKLDVMRRKIETEARESTSRASFKCQGCHKC